jgi:CBS domain-containing protein
MLMRDVLITDVVCCKPTATAVEVANLMREHHVGDVVVLATGPEPRTPIGVITDRDLAVEVMAKGIDPGGIHVKQFMRTPVVIAHESEEAELVIERMRLNGVRRVPVVDREQLVGIVTMNDLLCSSGQGVRSADRVISYPGITAVCGPLRRCRERVGRS